MKRIYYVIGRIIEKTQLLEKLIGEVVYYSEAVNEADRNKGAFSEKGKKLAVESAEYLKNKMETMTLGQVVGVVYSTRVFLKSEVDELKFVLERRNYFVHEYFKYTPFDELQKSEKDMEEEYGALKEYYAKIDTIYKKADIYCSSYKSKFEKIFG